MESRRITALQRYSRRIPLQTPPQRHSNTIQLDLLENEGVANSPNSHHEIPPPSYPHLDTHTTSNSTCISCTQDPDSTSSPAYRLAFLQASRKHPPVTRSHTSNVVSLIPNIWALLQLRHRSLPSLRTSLGELISCHGRS